MLTSSNLALTTKFSLYNISLKLKDNEKHEIIQGVTQEKTRIQ